MSELEHIELANELVLVDDIADPARPRMYLKEASDVINKNGCTSLLVWVTPMIRS